MTKKAEIVLGGYTTFFQIPLKKPAKYTVKTQQMVSDGGTNRSFRKLKRTTKIPFFALYTSANKIQIRNASTKKLGATLCHSQEVGDLKLIGFTSAFSMNPEKKYEINELEILSIV